MMIIGLNGQKILSIHPAGPEKYTIHVFEALMHLDRTNNYILYLDSEPSEGFFAKISGGNPNCRYKVIKDKISWTQLGLAQELFKNPVDVYFTPVHTIPVIHPPNTKIVAMVHGLEYKTNKELKKNSLKYLIHPLILKTTVAKAAQIIVPSNYTRQQLIEARFTKQISKINVINEGVNQDFGPKDQDEINSVLQKYGLKFQQYLFFVGTIQPRKNIPVLVEGFAKVLREEAHLDELKLVIAGKKGWNYQESLEAPARQGVTDKVVFLDYVPQEELPFLLAGASAYINASYMEGFGLPLVEALASGIQPIVSDIPAHREVGGIFPIFIDPYDDQSIKDGIQKHLHREKPYDSTSSIVWAKQFSWDETAKKTLKVFETA